MHENTNAPMNVTEPLNVDSDTAVSTHGWRHVPMYICSYVHVYKCISQVSSFTKEPDSENEH